MSQKTSKKASEIRMPPKSPLKGSSRRTSTTSGTTLAPTITTAEGPISNYDLEMLQDHIRQLNGMPVTMPMTRRRISSPCKPPRKPPRQTETSRIRAEMWKKCRLMQRSSYFIKYHTNGQHIELLPGDKPLNAEKEKKLLNETKNLTVEEISVEKQRAEADYLKYLASKVRRSKDFRQNRASEYRFKYARGEPIVSSLFKSNYDRLEKPPFYFVRRYTPIVSWKLPPIDKEKEMWLLPQEDERDIPLYLIPKEMDSKKKVKRKELKRGKRTKHLLKIDPIS